MSYAVQVSSHAGRSLAKAPVAVQSAIRPALVGLAADSRPPGCQKLQGRPGWRIRVGRWRIIYAIDDPAQTVTILEIGPRPDVYRP
ncbi:MAG: type II toxin-antitoxin system RelE family toxin [Chloroflexia bacterium]